MTDRHSDVVDAFLADLRATPVPEDLTATVLRRVRDERPPRVSRVSPWLAAAAALVTAALALTAFAWLGAGPVPPPTPPPSASVPPSAQASPTSSSLPSPTASSAPAVSASPGQTPTPPVLGTWQIDLDPPGEPVAVMSLTVVDYAGTMSGVEQPTASRPPAVGGPNDLAIGPGGDVRSITVAWTGGICDERAWLELAADGHTLRLRFPPRPSCDAIGIEFAVKLRFSQLVDAAAFSGTSAKDLVSVADVDPRGMAFRDAQRGFVAGRTPNGDVTILETTDGGATWRVEGLGAGEFTDMGVMRDGRAWAGKACPEGFIFRCDPGLYRYDQGSWAKVDTAWPVSLSFEGDVGAGLFRVADGPRNDAGIPIPELRLMDEGGVWSAVEIPCPTTMVTQDVSRVGASTIVVLCESEGATGNSTKELHRSTDGGLTWTRFADGPYTGTGMHMDLHADGTGWMWGARSPLLATADGGMTWTPLDVADGDVRTVSGADALGSGAGVALVRDPDRELTFLLSTADGKTWNELASFPVYCCGG